MADRNKPELDENGQVKLVQGTEHHAERPVPTADLKTKSQVAKWNSRSGKRDDFTSASGVRTTNSAAVDAFGAKVAQTPTGTPYKSNDGRFAKAQTTQQVAGGHFRPGTGTARVQPPLSQEDQHRRLGTQPPRATDGHYSKPGQVTRPNTTGRIDASQPSTVTPTEDQVDPTRPQNARQIAAATQEARNRQAFLDSRVLPKEMGTAKQTMHTQQNELQRLRYQQAALRVDNIPNSSQQADFANLEQTEMTVEEDLELEKDRINRSTETQEEITSLDAKFESTRGMPSQSRVVKQLKVELYDEIFDRLKGKGASIPERAAVVSKVETELGLESIRNIDSAKYAESLGLSHEEFRQFRELHEAIHHGATRDQQEATVQAQIAAKEQMANDVLGPGIELGSLMMGQMGRVPGAS